MSGPTLTGWAIFGLGCGGAVLPEILRLYNLRHKPPKFTGFYFCISAMYVAGGGFIASMVSGGTAQGAVYAGITWPLIVTQVLHRRGASRTKPIENRIALANSRNPGVKRPSDEGQNALEPAKDGGAKNLKGPKRGLDSEAASKPIEPRHTAGEGHPKPPDNIPASEGKIAFERVGNKLVKKNEKGEVIGEISLEDREPIRASEPFPSQPPRRQSDVPDPVLMSPAEWEKTVESAKSRPKQGLTQSAQFQPRPLPPPRNKGQHSPSFGELIRDHADGLL